MERFFDVVFSVIALLLLSPILIVVILILRFTGEGEVFYQQERVGLHGKTFGLLKFATMLKNSPTIGTGTVTIKDDPRVLPFGRFLRRTKINELPQLINVFLGDMSLIGPRPLTSQTFNMYTANEQKTLSTVRPGLSGLGSIYFRNEEDLLQGLDNPLEYYSSVIAPKKAKIEIYFIRHKTLLLYFELIFITVIAVLFSRNFDAHRFVETKLRKAENKM